MPQYDYYLLLDNSHKHCKNSNSNSQNYIDFGVTTPSSGYNPALTYVKAGKHLGVHIVVTQAYTGLNSGMNVWVQNGASSTGGSNLVARFLSRAKLNVAGNHFFLPIPPGTLLEFVKLNCHRVGATNASAGKLTTWLGPDADGAE